MLKHQCRSTFGNWDAEKVSPDLQKSTPPRPQFSTCLPLWRSIRSNAEKHHTFGPLLDVEMSKKCTPLSGEAHFEVKMLTSKTPPHVRTTFGRSNIVFCGRHDGFCTNPKVSNTREFCGSCKKDGRREWDVWRGSAKMHVWRSRRGMCIRDVRRSGRWFPERGCILEHQIFRFAKMILRGRCSKAYYFTQIHRWSWKIANRIGTRPSPPHSTFHFWRSLAKRLRLNCQCTELLRFGPATFHFWRKTARIRSLQTDRW